MAAQSTTQWAAFFDGHAPEYEENCFTDKTIAEVDFLVDCMPRRRCSCVGDTHH